MAISVRWSEGLARYAGTAAESGSNFEAGMTPTEIAQLAGLSDTDLSAVVVFVDGVLAPMDRPLGDSADVMFDLTIHGR